MAGIERYRVVARSRRGAGTVRSAEVSVEVAPDEVIIDDRVVVLTAAEAALLTTTPDHPYEQPQRFTFDNLTAPLSLHRLRPGQVMSVPPSTAAPRGALVEITGRQVGALQTTLDLTLASLADVVVNVPDARSEIRLHQVGEPRLQAARAGVRLEPPPTAGAGTPVRIAVDISSTTDLDGGRPPARTVGSIELDPVVGLVYDTDWGRVDRYRLQLGWKVDDRLRTTMRRNSYPYGAEDTHLFDLAMTFVGTIGRLPVWFTLSERVDLNHLNSAYGERNPVATVDVRRLGAAVATFSAESDDVKPEVEATLPSMTTMTSEAGPGRGVIVLETETALSLYSAFTSYRTGHAVVSTISRAPGSSSCTTERTARGLAQLETEPIWQTLLGSEGWIVMGAAPEQREWDTSCPSAPPLEIITDRLPEVVIGEEYGSAVEVADHRSGTWQVDEGELPPGLSLTSDGRVSGTYVGPESQTTIGVAFTDTQGAVVRRTIAVRTTTQRTGSRWTSIEGGPTSCGIQTDGTGWCWGDNQRGQVGNGTAQPQPAPVRLAGTWSSITPGLTSCGVQTDGSGWCWGENFYGQVGDGTTTDRSSPVRVPGQWRTLQPGTTTCGIQVDGTGWCWGLNTRAQIPDGTSENHLTPHQVPGRWRTLRPGGTSCGVRTDNTLWCSVPSTLEADGTYTPSPPARLGNRHWRSVSGGWPHIGPVCGMLTDGTGWCEQTMGGEPAPVPGELSSYSLGHGTYGTQCAIGADRTGWCWGDNSYGQVGSGESSSPVEPHQLTGSWRTLTSGVRTCGVRSDDTAWCWGYNGYGGVGNGTTSSEQRVPARVPGLWSQVDAACGIRIDGTAWCWGTSGLGPVADGTTVLRTTPVQVP